jgi:hypothetical protein
MGVSLVSLFSDLGRRGPRVTCVTSSLIDRLAP